MMTKTGWYLALWQADAYSDTSVMCDNSPNNQRFTTTIKAKL